MDEMFKNINLKDLNSQKNTLNKIIRAFSTLGDSENTTEKRKNLCDKIVNDCDNLADLIDMFIEKVEKSLSSE